MKRPNNAELFKNIVLDKIRIYCETNIWPYKFDEITAWLNNFDCDIEEYVALQLLDNLIVRSNDMAKSNYSRLFCGSLRQHIIENTSIESNSIQDWKSKLKKGCLNSELAVFPAKIAGDSGDSSEVIFRMLSGILNTNKYSEKSIDDELEVVIFVDDFLGSGDQFKDFAAKINLNELLTQKHVFYCPLIAFETGYEHIKKLYPQLNIIPTEFVYENDSLFWGDDNAHFKNDLDNTIGEFKLKLKQMRKKYAPNMPNWFGYKKASLPLAFQWGCPNQTPSILYMDRSNYVSNWQQLFSRRA